LKRRYQSGDSLTTKMVLGLQISGSDCMSTSVLFARGVSPDILRFWVTLIWCFRSTVSSCCWIFVSVGFWMGQEDWNQTLVVELCSSSNGVSTIEAPVITACLSIFPAGINAILYYAPMIFQNLGLTGSSVSLLATGVVGIAWVRYSGKWSGIFNQSIRMLLAIIPAVLVIDQLGRRPVLISGAFLMGMWVSIAIKPWAYRLQVGATS